MKSKKIGLIAVCAVLVLAASVFGTIAYLTDTTETVQNTFTIGTLLDDSDEFVLKEHEATDADNDGVYTLSETSEVDGNTYTVLPGVDLPKDPFVKTTGALEMDAYVFVEVVDETGTALSFTVDNTNWTELTDVTGPNGGTVYRLAANDGIAEAGSALGPVSILAKNTNGKEITVANEAISDADAQFGGDVTFYGYMIQAGGFDSASAAWTAGFAGSDD